MLLNGATGLSIAKAWTDDPCVRHLSHAQTS